MVAAATSAGERLRDAALVLTGASGFLGKAVLATWLEVVAEPGPITVVLRAADDAAAHARLEREILSAAPFAALEADRVAALLDAGALRAVAADLTADDLGGLRDGYLAGADVVIHCAASVSFEEPLDDMLELNVLGAVRLVDAVTRAGARPAFVHVSTAYAAGRRTGFVPERPFGSQPGDPAVDLDAELDAARAWRRAVDLESRTAEQQRRFAAEAARELGPAGALSVGSRAEDARRDWIAARLTELGRQRARTLGWTDAYTLSKGLAERELLTRRHARPLTIVRPSVIESALQRPHPGWLEGLKVADPVILAYGRGLVPRFPGDRHVRLDVVPVDLVANACVAAAAHPARDGDQVRTVAIVSGARNPLRVGQFVDELHAHFREDPLGDDDGLPTEVGPLRVEPGAGIARRLATGARALAAGRRVLDRVAPPGGDGLERALHRRGRQVERLQRLAEIYGPYGELDCVFDDREARALGQALDAGDAGLLAFDPAAIDWKHYLRDVHLPSLRALVASDRPPRRTARREPEGLPDGRPAIAFFDVEGVVLDATLPQAYAWLRTRSMPRADRVPWLTGFAAAVPGMRRLDRRSRAAFNRKFYRRYRDLSADELRGDAADVLGGFILPRIQQAAVRRIRAHRRRGDRVILLTGAADFLVAPLRHLGDELVAARLVERDGAFTGELDQPPLTADGRAAFAAARAADHGVDMADCHAYGDAISDLPLLEAVGHPHAVNADFRLAREARRRGWPLLGWSTEPGRGTAPVVPAET